VPVFRQAFPAPPVPAIKIAGVTYVREALKVLTFYKQYDRITYEDGGGIKNEV
jgi:hypothetical protein